MSSSRNQESVANDGPFTVAAAYLEKHVQLRAREIQETGERRERFPFTIERYTSKGMSSYSKFARPRNQESVARDDPFTTRSSSRRCTSFPHRTCSNSSTIECDTRYAASRRTSRCSSHHHRLFLHSSS